MPDAPSPRANRADTQGRELRARGRTTQRRLLDAGIEVFSRRGFHAARVDDIVQAAKTSHGTFYLYFANKEDLFAALVADVAEEMSSLTAGLGPVTPDDAGRAALRAWLERFAELYGRYGPVLRTWTEAEIDQSELGRLGTDLLGDLARGLAERIELPPRGPTSDRLDPNIAALAIVAMVERFSYLVDSHQIAIDQPTMLDTLTRAGHDGLFGAAAHP